MESASKTDSKQIAGVVGFFILLSLFIHYVYPWFKHLIF